MGVFRTVFSTAPPFPGPQIDFMDLRSTYGDHRLLYSIFNSNFCLHMFKCCLFTNFNFAVYTEAVSIEESTYKVVSVFSCYDALALSIIHTHIIVKPYQTHYHNSHTNGEICDKTDVGTTSVQSLGINHCPGHVICLISPNGD
jgi:hypothetical protein